jgi:RNA polymerase primary sigma factor
LPLIGAFVSDADTPAEEMEDKEISEMLSRCLSELSPRSAEMIRKRYGLDGAEAQSYLQIAEAESPPLSRERVRQVIRDGFTALKKKPRLARLAAEALTGEVAHA